jgi:D-glycero-D-manno-heptose 1,7-bisphosphate phosphatase
MMDVRQDYTGWTLFLDRDGVINERLPGDYVKDWSEFQFLDGVLDAMPMLSAHFDTIVMVTNQQGIGKGLMTETDLEGIHQEMMGKIIAHDGRVDQIFHCPELAAGNPSCRKPNSGMALQAKELFPSIDFERSLIVGDSPTDMQFGEKVGMQCAFIGQLERYTCFESLIHFARVITSK